MSDEKIVSINSRMATFSTPLADVASATREFTSKLDALGLLELCVAMDGWDIRLKKLDEEKTK